MTADDELLDKAMTQLRDQGFINYYGLQRFGSVAAIPTHEIGKLLLKAEWQGAIDLILKPREGERDGRLKDARKIYQETHDAALAGQKLKNEMIESKLLRGIAICGLQNPQGALDMVPRNTLLMYIHAYQSFVWNKVVSRRIKEFGLKPIVGDLVYADPTVLKDDEEYSVFSPCPSDKAEEDEEKTNETEKPEETEKPKEEEMQKEEVKSDSEAEKKKGKRDRRGKKIEHMDSVASEEEKPLPEVKILTKKDLNKYKITDVVIPQPGWRVIYPAYAKAWYDEYLEQDGLNTDLKQKNR